MPRRATPSAIAGESATMRDAPWYAAHSRPDAAARSNGLRSAPMAMGNSGHRSRTSNTIGARRPTRAASPGSAMVSGVLVAKTTSAFCSSATAVAATAKRANAAMRVR
ncbi:MAG: hypothetical protein U0168_28065 [Nannocystaceae bacterium]